MTTAPPTPGDSTRVTLKGGRDTGMVFNPPVTVIHNDLIRYLFAYVVTTTDELEGDEWLGSRCSDNAPAREVAS